LLITNFFFIGFISLFSPASGNGLNRIRAFRSSKLGTMGSENASKEYMKTAWIDALDDGDKSTARVKDYLNSRLSSMPNQDGYDFVKNKK
jgi:hypothetical protein